MPRHSYIIDRCSDIHEMLQYASSQSANNPSLGAHLAAYISVLISGVVEDCIEFLVAERARQSSDSELAEFVRTSIDRLFRNPDSGALANMLGNFSAHYRESYRQSVGEDSREALGSIVRNRLSLAHSGRSQNDFTVSDVQTYFEKIVPVLEVVENILLPV